MKVLVTGGAGFIGSHLVDRLIADGHEVHVIDDFSTGRTENLHRWAIWSVPIALHAMKMFLAPRYDWIFHLAGRADLVPSIDDPSSYFETNVMGTVHILEQARKRGCSRFIYASSSSLYGATPPVHRAVTEWDEVNPAHPYAFSKKLGEDAVLHWGKVYGLPVVSLRLFNVYGPRARTSGAYGAVMGTFLAQRANGAPLTIVGDGTQRRDFVWVEDVADAFVKAAESDHVGVYNIGTGYASSINRLAALIGGPVVRVPARGGEPSITQADATKAARELGWTASTTLADGVGRLLADLTPFKNAPVWTPDTIAEATKQWHQCLG